MSRAPFFLRWSARARRLAALHDLRLVAGSMFHHCVELSHCDPRIADELYQLSSKFDSLLRQIAAQAGVRL